MTETTYPYPGGAPTAPAIPNVVRVPLENLPDYATGDAETDLALLETLLTRNGYRIVYVDLTRKDTGIPVVRAIIPGLEINADFDRFSRLSPRLFRNYLSLHKKSQ